ncbi:uncharacterized protein BXZ73DRAFT_108311 [Epithele typhae]|uniref:uncharacterized protein n=1 Tax=Epithele typhae TaxID=378194 RepID=UPI00200879A3|nr:uncharacterized protein BXZ73DRAFT_108311 [Epithele typhae]KAH9910990.1 hypothetical protein BXZ73DRAFT_108311 [Epithele typhae]
MFPPARVVALGAAPLPVSLPGLGTRLRLSAVRAINVHAPSANHHASPSEASWRLPATFFCLYRLFLRTAAASVLHDRKTKKQLRRIYRPMFTEAGRRMHELQDERLGRELGPGERAARVAWLAEWEERVDNTLSFLHTSAVARGVPHRTLRNFRAMQLLNSHVFVNRARLPQGPVWSGQFPLDHLRYRSPKFPPFKPTSQDALATRGMHMLADTIGMAEAQGRLTLGRVGKLKWSQHRVLSDSAKA